MVCLSRVARLQAASRRAFGARGLVLHEWTEGAALRETLQSFALLPSSLSAASDNPGFLGDRIGLHTSGNNTFPCGIGILLQGSRILLWVTRGGAL